MLLLVGKAKHVSIQSLRSRLKYTSNMWHSCHKTARHSAVFVNTPPKLDQFGFAVQVEPVRWSQQKARTVLNDAIEGSVSEEMLAAAAEAVAAGYEGSLSR